LAEGKIKDFVDTSTDTDILIKVKGDFKAIEKLLIQKVKLTNMHAFNHNGIIKKYDSPNQILFEFVGVRLELYQKRIEFLLKTLKEKLPYHENVVRFIRQQCEPISRPDLRKKTPEECDSLLLAEKFDKIKDSFDYLMNLPIASLTLKHALKHEKDLETLKQQITELENTTSKELWLKELSLVKD
jgi:DNA topoisomerase-2